MKILQLCHKPPFPPTDGGCKAMHNITEGLLNTGNEVKVVVIETHKHPVNFKNYTKEYLDKTGLEAIFVNTKINLVDAFCNLITRDSYNVERFFSIDFDLRLGKLLEENKYDIIHLESLFMTPYIDTLRRFSKAKIVLRSHNLEYIIWERIAEHAKNPAKKVYVKHLAKQLKRYELNVFKKIDGIAAITSIDKNNYKKLGAKCPIETIPFGLNLEEYTATEKSSSNTNLFYLGALDWTPNIEGINWLMENVWPLVIKKDKTAKLLLAGRRISPELAARKDKGLIVIGEVENATEFIENNAIMLVPLLSGGGMRVKIIEGMALKKPIIATKIAAEGIDCQDGKDIIICDKPEDFANAILDLKSNPEKISFIGQNARNLVEDKYNNNLITQKLLGFYNSLLN